MEKEISTILPGEILLEEYLKPMRLGQVYLILRF